MWNRQIDDPDKCNLFRTLSKRQKIYKKKRKTLYIRTKPILFDTSDLFSCNRSKMWSDLYEKVFKGNFSENYFVTFLLFQRLIYCLQSQWKWLIPSFRLPFRLSNNHSHDDKCCYYIVIFQHLCNIARKKEFHFSYQLM